MENPLKWRKLGTWVARCRLKRNHSRGTLAEDKPPILGLIHRRGDLVLWMLPNVQPATIQPVIQQTGLPGSLNDTGQYERNYCVPKWGYAPRPSTSRNASMLVPKTPPCFEKVLRPVWERLGSVRFNGST